MSVTEEPRMKVQRLHNATTVLALTGPIDFHSAPGIRAQAIALISEGHRHLVLDLSQVGFCDSSGLNAFLNIWHCAQAAGGTFVLTAVPDRLDRLIRITGLCEVLPTRATTDDALAALRPSPRTNG
jgi:anti-sigma B factor antagonist